MTDVRIRLLAHPGTISAMLLFVGWTGLGVLMGRMDVSPMVAYGLGGVTLTIISDAAHDAIPTLDEVVDDD